MTITTARSGRLAATASAYLAEEELADAIVLLDRAVGGAQDARLEARALCERAGVDVNKLDELQDLLQALSTRLSEMTGGRSEAFNNALQTYPPEERFSLPALAEALWPAVENLRRYVAGEPLLNIVDMKKGY